MPDSGSITAKVIRILTIVAAVAAAALVALLIWLGNAQAPLVTIIGAFLLAALAIGGWLLVNRLAAPLDRLALDLAVIARDNPDHALRVGTHHWLARVVAGVDALRRNLSVVREDRAAALAEATSRAEEQKRQLEAVLLDLGEAVVVCNLQHQVLLYNPAATALLDSSLGLGRSLFAVLTREPVLHALEQEGETSPRGPAGGRTFVCATTSGRLLRARLGMIIGAEGKASGFTLVMRDVAAELDAAARRDDLLLSATEGFRAPLANLHAAAETLAGNPDIAPADRKRFETVLLEESGMLCDRLEGLAKGYRDLGGVKWFMAEIHSSDLFASLRRRLAATPQAPLVTAVGLPAWLSGDSLSLLVLLDHLVRRLHEHLGVDAFDAAVTPGGGRVHLDLIWVGAPVAPSVIDRWLETPLTGGLGPITGRAVLGRHASDAWSQPGRSGEALLRMPLPSAEPVVRKAPLIREARPEFYDFDLLRQPLPTGAMAEWPLRQVSYVVFDLETTGLRPSEGDEVVAIAAVRVVNGRVLTMETFDRLVNPGRRIPAESTSFHGITDDQVKDKPPFTAVLPQFRSFAADAVLVAHNAAFDLKFLHQTGEQCGIRFDQPVLDTLLLSAYLDPDEPDHSLDAIAARFGLTFTQRHSALGDSLVTAAILVHLLDRLEQRRLPNLGTLIKATGMTAEIRARQRQF